MGLCVRNGQGSTRRFVGHQPQHSCRLQDGALFRALIRYLHLCLFCLPASAILVEPTPPGSSDCWSDAQFFCQYQSKSPDVQPTVRACMQTVCTQTWNECMHQTWAHSTCLAKSIPGRVAPSCHAALSPSGHRSRALPGGPRLRQSLCLACQLEPTSRALGFQDLLPRRKTLPRPGQSLSQLDLRLLHRWQKGPQMCPLHGGMEVARHEAVPPWDLPEEQAWTLDQQGRRHRTHAQITLQLLPLFLLRHQPSICGHQCCIDFALTSTGSSHADKWIASGQGWWCSSASPAHRTCKGGLSCHRADSWMDNYDHHPASHAAWSEELRHVTCAEVLVLRHS